MFFLNTEDTELTEFPSGTFRFSGCRVAATDHTETAHPYHQSSKLCVPHHASLTRPLGRDGEGLPTAPASPAPWGGPGRGFPPRQPHPPLGEGRGGPPHRASLSRPLGRAGEGPPIGMTCQQVTYVSASWQDSNGALLRVESSAASSRNTSCFESNDMLLPPEASIVAASLMQRDHTSGMGRQPASQHRHSLGGCQRNSMSV